MKYKHLIGKPFIKNAKELVHHEEGQGTRHVFLDERVISESNIYVIVRDLEHITENKISHVHDHMHKCDSAFLFIGEGKNLEGLTCEVTLDNEKYKVKSPASVFIPKGLKHSYRLISGSGLYINIVLAPTYNESLVK